MNSTTRARASAASTASGPDAASSAAAGGHLAAAPDRDRGAIDFPHGLPGFPGATRFELRPFPGAAADLLVLQSADDPELRFLVLPYASHGMPLSQMDVEDACVARGIGLENAAVLLV